LAEKAAEEGVILMTNMLVKDVFIKTIMITTYLRRDMDGYAQERILQM